MDTLAHFGQAITIIGSILGYAVAGVFGVLYFTAQGQRERRKETDDLSDGLITRLQQTVNQLQLDGTDREERMRTLQSELDHMRGRNSLLEEVLKGRDPQMQEVLKLIPKQGQDIQELTQTLSKFINTLQPILIHMETAAVK